MTAQRTAMTLRLAVCLAAIGAGSAAANTPRTFPYTESFELTAPGTQLVGADGWYGETPAYLTVQTDAAQPSATPPFPLAAHTRTARIGGPAELRFQNTAGRTNATVDLSIKPVRGDRPKTLVTTNYLQYALYVNTAGRIVIHHGNYSWSSPPDYQPFLPYWTELQHTPLSTSELARITITVDYKTFQFSARSYLRLFQVKLNGVPLTHPDGLKNPGFTMPPPPKPADLNGSWFFCLDADDPDHTPVGNLYPAGQLGGFGCFGAGAIDDVFVHDSTNVPTHTLTIQSTYAGARGVPPIPSAAAYGYGAVVVCSVTNSPASTGAGARMVCAGWIDGAGTVPPSGSSLVTTVTVNRASSLKWNWRQEYLLDTSAGAGGTVDTPDGWYAAGTNVTIEALPETDMIFGGWTGDVPAGSTNSNPLALTMDRARAVTATFRLPGSEPRVAAMGTPIAWLQEFGATNDYDQAELEDWDEDGAAGWEEYLAGTDPNDPESVFQLLSHWRSGGMVYISWFGTTNSGVTDGFGVERSGNLRDWTQVVTGGWPRAANGTNVWWDTNPPATGSRFYRPFIPRD